MSDEFEFFSNDCNNWNYNPFINTPNTNYNSIIILKKNYKNK